MYNLIRSNNGIIKDIKTIDSNKKFQALDISKLEVISDIDDKKDELDNDIVEEDKNFDFKKLYDDTILEANKEKERIINDAFKFIEIEKEKAIKEGRNIGIAESQQVLQEKLESLEMEYENKSIQLENEYRSKIEQLEPEITKFIIKSVEKITKKSYAEYEELLYEFVKIKLSEIDELEEIILLKVSSKDYDCLKNSDLSTNFKVLKDETLDDGNVIVEMKEKIIKFGIFNTLDLFIKDLKILAGI